MKLKNKTLQEIKEIFKPGKTFYFIGGKFHVINYTFDGDIELIIVKSRNRYHNRWCYEVWKFKEIFYEVNVRFGHVSLTKPKRRRS